MQIDTIYDVLVQLDWNCVKLFVKQCDTVLKAMLMCIKHVRCFGKGLSMIGLDLMQVCVKKMSIGVQSPGLTLMRFWTWLTKLN